jgi:hypothetical protein
MLPFIFARPARRQSTANGQECEATGKLFDMAQPHAECFVQLSIQRLFPGNAR